MNKKNIKVIFLHTGLRIYRIKLFELLSKTFNIDFFLTENIRKDRHVKEETKRIVSNNELNIIQSKEIESLPFAGFSFDMFKLPFKKYDVYIFTSSISVPFLVIAPILKLMGKKIVLFDELWRYPKEILKYKLIFPYVKFILNNCVSSVVTAGTKAKNMYISEYKYYSNNIFVAYNSTVDVNDYIYDLNLDTKIKDKLANYTSKKRILYLARVIEIKGLDILIQSMQSISEDYELVVVGEGDYLSYCKDMTSELNLSNRVHFLGGCLSTETSYFYKNCDIYVLPTKMQLNKTVQVESWGFTVNEAMLSEIAVITTTAVGSSYDLINESYSGCIAEASSVESLTEKINYVIENNKDNIIGKRGRTSLLKNNSYEDNIISYKEAINNAINK